MAKINGTATQIYADGVLIACQKGLSFAVQQSPIPATNKSSGGWEEHENGMRSATVSVDALISTTGLSAGELIAYIVNRKSLLLVIEGIGTWVMEADISNVSLTGAMEDVATVSGSFKVKGRPYLLDGANAQLITTWSNFEYETFTGSGSKITTAINTSGDGSAITNTMNISDTDIIKIFVFLTLNSGTAPTVRAVKNAGANYISNAVLLVAGLNLITLVATESNATAQIFLTNLGSNTNFSTSNVYCFKDNP